MVLWTVLSFEKASKYHVVTKLKDISQMDTAIVYETLLFIYIPNTWKPQIQPSRNNSGHEMHSYPPYVSKVSWICSWEKVYLLQHLARPQDHTLTYTGTEGAELSHTECKCTELYGNHNDVYILSTERRVECELREAFSEISYALFTPHPDYSEEGGWHGVMRTQTEHSSFLPQSTTGL